MEGEEPARLLEPGLMLPSRSRGGARYPEAMEEPKHSCKEKTRSQAAEYSPSMLFAPTDDW